jgi:hypothetical protein
VEAQPDPAAIGVIMIGSVAETGDRTPPLRWGRVGDPVRVSAYDTYGQGKVAAERLLVDNGLPRWAWLRQTGIFHPGLLVIRDPIMTHVPLGGSWSGSPSRIPRGCWPASAPARCPGSSGAASITSAAARAGG